MDKSKVHTQNLWTIYYYNALYQIKKINQLLSFQDILYRQFFSR